MQNIPAHKATAKLIVALAEPRVEKAMDEGKVDEAMAFQSIVTTINMALETGAPIEFN